MSGWRIYKWSLAVQPKPTSGWQSFPTELFLSDILLSLIESQMVRKYVIHSAGHRGVSNGLLVCFEVALPQLPCLCNPWEGHLLCERLAKQTNFH